MVITFEFFAVLIVISTLFWLHGCAIFNSCRDNSHRNRERTFKGRISASNTVSFVHLVGVEGVGHHGVSPAIAEIAESCEVLVLPLNKLMRKGLFSNSTAVYDLSLKMIRNRRYSRKVVTLIEDSSFPTDDNYRVSSPEEKRAFPLYDLVGTHQRIRGAYSINLKYLYLTRDFYRTVASHPEFDGDFQKHAQVLSDFVQHVRAEYTAMNAIEPNLWRQISYEWFTEMKNCSSLVSSLVDFIGWEHCDVQLACTKLQRVIRQPSQKLVNATDQAYASTFDVNVPIPFLDYNP